MKTTLSLAVLGLAALSAAQLETANNVVVSEVFRDFTTSNFTSTVNYPSSVVLSDLNLQDDGAGGSFANRFDATFANGTTPIALDPTQGFSVFFDLRLDLPAGTPVSPRKEAGIRINGGPTGDALFIVNSDAGEIVAFGGGGPFFRFGQNSSGDGYTPGTTIRLGLTYDFDVATTTGFLTYSADGVSSPRQAFSNLERSFGAGATLSLYQQAGGISANAQQGTVTTFSNIAVAQPVPEPATMAALGLGALALLKRRRAGK